jgi:cell division protein FtsB
MRSFERRKGGITIWGFILRWAGALVLFLIMFFTVRAAWNMYLRFAAASESEKAATAELADLKERQIEVEAAVATLSSDRGVEAEVRERYGVALPGEGRIEIVRNDNTEEELGALEEGNIFKRIFRSIFSW